MSEITLPVEIREKTGTGGARSTRREGHIPGVIYGGPRGAIPIAIPLNDVRKNLGKGQLLAHMINIEHRGERQQVIVRDIQFDPVTDIPIHMDLYRVEEDQIITVDVTVRFTNEVASPGLKRGGVLNIERHQLALDCPAGSIPQEVVVDLTGLEIGDTVHASDIAMPEGAKAHGRPAEEISIATVQGSRAATEAAQDDDSEGGGEES